MAFDQRVINETTGQLMIKHWTTRFWCVSVLGPFLALQQFLPVLFTLAQFVALSMAFFAKLADHKRSLFTFILLANLLLLRFWLLFLFLSNAKFSLRFLRNRQVSYSPTALGRALVLRESEANAGNFSPRRQTNVKKLRLSWQKKENFKRLMVLEISKLTYRIERSLFQTAKGKSAFHH